MNTHIQNITLGLLVLSLALLGSAQVLNAQQNKSIAPGLSVVTLEVTGMT